MTDFTIYTVDLDTQRPNPADNTKVLRGDPPRTAFSKYNDLLLALQGAVPHVGNEAPSPTVPFMKWFDTSVSPPVDRYRNAENTAWLVVPSASQIKELYESNPDTNAFTDSLLDKLANIAEQATKNATDAALRDRATHTGTQAIPTVTGLQSALDSKLASSGGVLTGNLTVPSLNGGQLAGMRSKIINGKMEIGQRGTSFPSALGLTYTLDRWIYVLAGVVPYGALTISQQSDAPSNAVSRDSLRVTVTTADTTIASGVLHQVKQVIEGYNVRDLIGRAFTLSFWVRSSKTGIHCVDFRNQVGMVDRSYIAEYTVNAADTWEKKAVTVPNGLITEGAWNWTNGAGLQVGFILASGTTFHGIAGEWQVGNLNATANQVNCLDTVGNIFAITDVQLEPGEVATPFEHRPYGLELLLCQRYYEEGTFNWTMYQQGGNGFSVDIPFLTQKRATPSLSIDGVSTINASNTIISANARSISSGAYATATGTVLFAGYYRASAEL